MTGFQYHLVRPMLPTHMKGALLFNWTDLNTFNFIYII